MTTTEANRLIDLVIEARATITRTFFDPSKENFDNDTAALTAVLNAIQAVAR